MNYAANINYFHLKYLLVSYETNAIMKLINKWQVKSDPDFIPHKKRSEILLNFRPLNLN